MTKASSDTLLELAKEFLEDLGTSLEAFTGELPIFHAIEVGRAVSISLAQSEQGSRGVIPLRTEEESLLGIIPKFRCVWDGKRRFLAVESSSFEVVPWVSKSREPLFRVEYIRNPKSQDIPSSHIQIHAHRDQFTHLLGYSGKSTRRARKRSERGLSDKGPPSVSEYHFPTGGPRFRPCLEDVLESLRIEFGLHVTEQWSDRLRQARINWRRIQTASVVRDCPEVAIQVLRDELGISIPDDVEIPGPNEVKLLMN